MYIYFKSYVSIILYFETHIVQQGFTFPAFSSATSKSFITTKNHSKMIPEIFLSKVLKKNDCFRGRDKKMKNTAYSRKYRKNPVQHSCLYNNMSVFIQLFVFSFRWIQIFVFFFFYVIFHKTRGMRNAEVSYDNFFNFFFFFLLMPWCIKSVKKFVQLSREIPYSLQFSSASNFRTL